VNNAGISGSSVGDPDGLEGWHRIIAINQTSVFLGTKFAAEQMAKTGGGSIVNISSIVEFVGSTSWPYPASASFFLATDGSGALSAWLARAKSAAVRQGAAAVIVQ